MSKVAQGPGEREGACLTFQVAVFLLRMGEHPGEPVIDLIQGQLPVGVSRMAGLAEKYRGPSVWASECRPVCSPSSPLGPLTRLRTGETHGGSAWTSLGVLSWSSERGAGWLQPNQRLGTLKSQGPCTCWRACEFLLEGTWLKQPLPSAGRKAQHS